MESKKNRPNGPTAGTPIQLKPDPEVWVAFKSAARDIGVLARPLASTLLTSALRLFVEQEANDQKKGD